MLLPQTLANSCTILQLLSKPAELRVGESPLCPGERAGTMHKKHQQWSITPTGAKPKAPFGMLLGAGTCHVP